MNDTSLSARIVAKWKANPKIGFSSPLTRRQGEIVQAMADGIAQAVVEELRASQVLVSGVTPGGGTAIGVIQ